MKEQWQEVGIETKNVKKYHLMRYRTIRVGDDPLERDTATEILGRHFHGTTVIERLYYHEGKVPVLEGVEQDNLTAMEEIRMGDACRAAPIANAG